MEILEPVVQVYERAKQRNVTIDLKLLGTTILECHPPIYREQWEVKVGDYVDVCESRDPRLYLVKKAGTFAPLLKL